MLSKAKGVDSIPETKEGQNRNIKDIFFSYFSMEQVKRMKEILEKGYYIPQEILNISDFTTICKVINNKNICTTAVI